GRSSACSCRLLAGTEAVDEVLEEGQDVHARLRGVIDRRALGLGRCAGDDDVLYAGGAKGGDGRLRVGGVPLRRGGDDRDGRTLEAGEVDPLGPVEELVELRVDAGDPEEVADEADPGGVLLDGTQPEHGDGEVGAGPLAQGLEGLGVPAAWQPVAG